MGYRALEEMRKINKDRYGVDGPQVPEMAATRRLADKSEVPVGGLEREALSFIRDFCEDLRFDHTGERGQLKDLDGTSVGRGQIPWNMEKDIDRLCLETSIHKFMESGIGEDAFDVYFCYLEMFMGNYSHSKQMIEMLAEFESNASTLLMKHRDHYSHSVYVFLIGIAVYHSNPDFRRLYRQFYGLEDKREAAGHFLKYWGLSSLFHDIGYPFEIPFEQVKSYFGKASDDAPFVSYSSVDGYVNIKKNQTDRELWSRLIPGEDKFCPDSLNEILACNIAYRLEKLYGSFEKYEEYKKTHQDKKYYEYLMEEVLANKPAHPEKFGKFMDHAYFSAIILFRQLTDVVGLEQIAANASEYMDVLTAIILHNSLYKFSITNYKSDYNKGRQFSMELHPLAWLLMLCDELQCWDRTSYGQNSRTEVHAMDCEMEFGENEIQVTYLFDERMRHKAEQKETKGTYRKLVNPDREHPEFLQDIENIVNVNQEGTLKLKVKADFKENSRLKKKYLSDTNFIHLYNFAVALNARYNHEGEEETISDSVMEEEFQTMSLEYKLSNIHQAKQFAGHLDAAGYFYTDRPVAYEMVPEFTMKDMEVIGPLEHLRWLSEKESMGWIYGERQPKEIREQTRTHHLMLSDGTPVNEAAANAHYQELSEYEAGKDIKPMNSMLKLIEKYDGLRIYKK